MRCPRCECGMLESRRMNGRVYLNCCECCTERDVDEESHDAEQARLIPILEKRRAEKLAAMEERDRRWREARAAIRAQEALAVKEVA